MRKEISKWEQQVWKDNIREIHKWTNESGRVCIFRFTGDFKWNSPIYGYISYGGNPESDPTDCRITTAILEIYGPGANDRDWAYCDRSWGNGWHWGNRNPDNDRYPLFDSLCGFTNQGFQIAFNKIDRLVSFIDVNPDFRGYDKTKELEFKDLIFLLLLCSKRIVPLPIEMAMTIVSFIRICELR